MIVSDYIPCPIAWRTTGFGLVRQGDLLNITNGGITSQHYEPQISCMADVAKIKDPVVTVDRAGTSVASAVNVRPAALIVASVRPAASTVVIVPPARHSARIVDRVASLATVPVEIVVHVVNSAIDLRVILVVAIVIVPLVVMALMPVVILGIVPAAIVVLVVSMETARPVIVVLVVSTETARLVIVRRAVILVIAPVVIVGLLVIVDPVVSTETDQLAIVGRVVNMATDRFVVTTVLTLVVAIVIVHLVEISATVIERLVVNSGIVTAPRVAMTQVLILAAAIVIAPLVAMALVLDVRQAHVVMTAAMPETEMTGVVDRVAKTSHLVDQRTKPSVVVKPCAHVAAVKCVKTASKHRCHAKPRPGLMKVELKTTYAMLPKVPCAVRSHRDALCRRDQKMKTN
jgi:hypothetical protein